MSGMFSWFRKTEKYSLKHLQCVPVGHAVDLAADTVAPCLAGSCMAS